MSSPGALPRDRGAGRRPGGAPPGRSARRSMPGRKGGAWSHAPAADRARAEDDRRQGGRDLVARGTEFVLGCLSYFASSSYTRSRHVVRAPEIATRTQIALFLVTATAYGRIGAPCPPTARRWRRGRPRRRCRRAGLRGRAAAPGSERRGEALALRDEQAPVGEVVEPGDRRFGLPHPHVARRHAAVASP